MPKTPATVSPASLRELRLAKSLSVREAATAVGLSPAAIRTWETGSSRPLVSHLRSIARAYGVTVEDLLTDSPQPSLAARRIRAGLLQKDVAAALGVSVSRYGAVERRDTPPPDDWQPILDELLGRPDDHVNPH